ncbi:MAG: Nif3-like dinuclear metal center hexameric protein [Bacteroidetes bacterium]|nr:MAG: Nif3-like dinuclear metal center hexameric protein [Bacteroidota bacterium]
MQLQQIISELELLAPPSYQESYDNAGLIVGETNKNISSALICFDVTEEVLEEAKAKGVNLIISHHPIIFKGLKKLNGKNYVERIVIDALKSDIALYAMHTNLDNVILGTNRILSEKLGLKNVKVLDPLKGRFRKLITYCPKDYAEKVRSAIFEAGAGHIGKYDQCSFNTEGQGSFRAGEDANPFVGKINQIHFEEEVRIETIFPEYLERSIISALKKAHPYEEVAFDIYKLENESVNLGAGIIGDMETPEDELIFLKKLKNITQAEGVRYTKLRNRNVKKVALCGGSGAFLIHKAKAARADVYITGDVKYHEFFDADGQIVIADIGHYESEQFTKELLISYIKEKFPTFAVQISEANTNPINYL